MARRRREREATTHDRLIGSEKPKAFSRSFSLSSLSLQLLHVLSLSLVAEQSGVNALAFRSSRIYGWKMGMQTAPPVMGSAVSLPALAYRRAQMGAETQTQPVMKRPDKQWDRQRDK